MLRNEHMTPQATDGQRRYSCQCHPISSDFGGRKDPVFYLVDKINAET